jgi:hypothetical protein
MPHESKEIPYLIAARDQFSSAQRSLVMAVRALQRAEMEDHFHRTIAATKEVIGDLAISVEQINDHLN